MRTKFQLKYVMFWINIHWCFIKLYRKKMDSLLSDGKIILSRKLSIVDGLLNYHCTKIFMLELKYGISLKVKY